MVKKADWIAISYNVPINPSKNRVYIWRKLRQFGAEYLSQGVAILPNSQQNIAKFKELSGKIKLMNGESTISELTFINENDTLDFIEKFKSHTKDEFCEIIKEVNDIRDSFYQHNNAYEQLSGQIKEIEKKYKKAKSREFFPESLSKELEVGLKDIKNAFSQINSSFSLKK